MRPRLLLWVAALALAVGHGAAQCPKSGCGIWAATPVASTQPRLWRRGQGRVTAVLTTGQAVPDRRARRLEARRRLAEAKAEARAAERAAEQA
ncbi:hypothetical protein FJT64_001455 [Amphibalanus amphitrite]|nr:hypothetical protein FJT64_001455 [Amphibalanus amphitrite]